MYNFEEHLIDLSIPFKITKNFRMQSKLPDQTARIRLPFWINYHFWYMPWKNNANTMTGPSLSA